MIKKYKRIHSGWFRRTSRFYLDKHLNKTKRDKLIEFLNFYTRIVQYFVNKLWSKQEFSNTLNYQDIKKGAERFKITSRLSSCAYKQAKEMVLSQSKLSQKKQRMPRMRAHVANLDSRFVRIEEFNGHFDMCVKFSSGLPRIVIPFNWTKHTNKFRNNGWHLASSIRLGYDRIGLFIDLIFEKERPKLKEEGRVLGIDRGYNAMLVASDGQVIGKELKEAIQRGGKRRKSWHHYIETEANRYLKQLKLDNVKVIVLENLKKVKNGTRGKFPRNLNRLLSFWHYARVGKRLKQLCEEKGIRIELKSPWKTSQRCSVCGNIDSRNRRSERFLCLSCGYAADADYNASRNLELLGLAGAYSLRFLPKGEINVNISPN